MVNQNYFGIVTTARNDNHGGNMIQRMQYFLNALFTYATEYQFNIELTIVEWNPPAEQSYLIDQLSWKLKNKYCRVKFIRVSNELHLKYSNSDKIQLHQMIAKNVGVRRSSADFILVTNIDIILSRDLFKFIASKQMVKNVLYRLKRYDVSPDIANELSLEALLSHCENNLMAVHDKNEYVNFVKGITSPIYDSKVKYNYKKLFTNAAGDFQLLSQNQWNELKGYPEFPIHPLYIDGIFSYMAYSNGVTEQILTDPMCVYHIEHDSFWNQSKNIDQKAYQKMNAVERMSGEKYVDLIQQMSNNKKPIIFNDDSWGLSQYQLNEIMV